MPDLLLLLLLLAVSFFYSSIGHGGASGYIAVFTLLNLSVAVVRPSALLLNVFVSGISFFLYYKAGHFKWKLFYPFALLSVPMAYAGSFIELDDTWYKRIVGVCLVVAVLRIIGFLDPKEAKPDREIPLAAGLLIGGALGFLSGMIGIGGGIILSPIILLFRWGTLKETAAVSALFIVVNSLAGILGLINQKVNWPVEITFWIPVVVVGGFAGAYWGSRHAGNIALKYVLSLVLFFAALKLILI